MKERSNENSVAQQYLNRVDVILGGGSQFFDPKKRSDRADLFEEFGSAGYQVVKNRQELLDAKNEKLLGTFSPNYIPYTIDHDHPGKALSLWACGGNDGRIRSMRGARPADTSMIACKLPELSFRVF